jgi:DNA-binding LacI/PurR family transcriptional regulator
MPRASRPARPTIRDVARRAGVSIQSVSNVINGRRGMVSADTRQRIERAMADLEYHPDAGARGLRSRRARTLAFLVLDQHLRYLADPLTDLMLAGVADLARDRGYGVLIQAARPDDRSADLLSPLEERRADGACVVLSGAPAVRRRHLDRLRRLGMPFVLFDELLSDPLCTCVTAQNEEGARELTRHLVERGHRRIAFIAARVPWPVIEQRHRGYRRALDEAGIAPDLSLERFEGGLGPSGGDEMVQRLLREPEPPTAVMATSDMLALGALRAARRAGLRVPGDVAVTGFDDFEFAAFVDPPLTTVYVPGYEMGRQGAEALLARIESDDTTLPARHEFAVELRVRDST